MTNQAKTDNANLPAKLALRRYFLNKYHTSQKPLVFDACQGEGVLWETIRRSFKCNYWGVDIKPKPGRLRVESSRMLAAPGFAADVIDIDTYGSPWRHWLALIKNLKNPATVFLTWGQIMMGGGNAPDEVLEISGAVFTRLKIPNYLKVKISERILPYMFCEAEKYGLKIIEAVKARHRGSAQYIGLRIEPAQSGPPSGSPKKKKAKKRVKQ